MADSSVSGSRIPPLVIGFWVLLFLVVLMVFLPCIECPVCGPSASSGEAMECVLCGNEQSITVWKWLNRFPSAPTR